jgi:hypothetical protein
MPLHRAHNYNDNNDPKMPPTLPELLGQAQLVQQMTQSLVSSHKDNDLPPEMLQLLESQSQMLQMMSHGMTNYNNKEDGASIPRACKLCGDLGHSRGEHRDQCPNCDGSHPAKECHTYQISCFLCEGVNHVPAQCHLYPIVQEMSVQVRDGMCQSMRNIHEGTRSKMKEEVEIKPQEAAHTVTTKC